MATATTPSTTKEPLDQEHDIICQDFLTKLSDLVPPFLSRIEEKLLQEHNLDVSRYPADHVCWRTETEQEYSKLVDALREGGADNECTLLIESRIGGRMISTFQLKHGIQVNRKSTNRTIHVLEIPAPKPGRHYRSGLEHVEFVIGGTGTDEDEDDEKKKPKTPVNDETHQSALDNLMKAHDSIQWKTKAKTKELNPDISLTLDLGEPLGGQCSVKFHLMPLAEVIEYEKRLAKNEGVL